MRGIEVHSELMLAAYNDRLREITERQNRMLVVRERQAAERPRPARARARLRLGDRLSQLLPRPVAGRNATTCMAC